MVPYYAVFGRYPNGDYNTGTAEVFLTPEQLNKLQESLRELKRPKEDLKSED